MYVPNHFQPQNLEEVEKFLKENTFATLVSYQDGKPIASHIPLLLVEKENGQKVLWGHISKANPQWKNIEEQEEVLAIFTDAHTYISSSWYNHVNVPTWNYIAVHAYGKAKIIEGDTLYQSVKDLVEKYEGGNQPRFHMEDLNEADMRRQLRGITGLEMSLDRVEASFKLSQNRNPEDHQNVIKQLENRGDDHSQRIADEMKKFKK